MTLSTLPLKGKSASQTGKRAYTLLPDGPYKLVITAAKVIDDQYGGLRLRLRVIDGDFRDHEFTVRAFPDSQPLRFLVELLGEDPGADEVEIDLADLVGFDVCGDVAQHTSKQGYSLNIVRRFWSVGSPVAERTPQDG